MNHKLILASASPRRKKLLEDAGFTFTVTTADIEESMPENADPENVAIMGGSFGGYAAIAGAAFEPDLYKAAIGYAGVYNYDRELLEEYRGKGEIADWLEPMIGDIKNNPEIYKDVSPVNFADAIRAEVLLIHGDADNTVSSSQTKRMSKALKAVGKEHVIEINTWGVHGLYDQKERTKWGVLVGEYLKRHLKKSEQ